jgi:hypothetical protein
MTDLTLGQFGSLSKQELSLLLKREELEMHGSPPAPSIPYSSASVSTRLRRLLSSGLHIPLSLQKRFFRTAA